MTEDSVRRLAEIRAREVITSHPLLLEVVGAVDVLCSMIDSLTAERDRALGTAMTFSKAATDVLARAEAAEAREARLREALGKVRAFQYDDRLTSASAYSMCRIADAALATPPSEGGQS